MTKSMTKSKFILGTSIGALILGLAGFAAVSLGIRDALAKDLVVVTDDQAPSGDNATSNDAGQTGDNAGTQDEQGAAPGDEQGAAPGDDTEGNASDQGEDDSTDQGEDSEPPD